LDVRRDSLAPGRVRVRNQDEKNMLRLLSGVEGRWDGEPHSPAYFQCENGASVARGRDKKVTFARVEKKRPPDGVTVPRLGGL
jgi:hypothetical protein